MVEVCTNQQGCCYSRRTPTGSKVSAGRPLTAARTNSWTVTQRHIDTIVTVTSSRTSSCCSSVSLQNVSISHQADFIVDHNSKTSCTRLTVLSLIISFPLTPSTHHMTSKVIRPFDCSLSTTICIILGVFQSLRCLHYMTNQVHTRDLFSGRGQRRVVKYCEAILKYSFSTTLMLLPST